MYSEIRGVDHEAGHSTTTAIAAVKRIGASHLDGRRPPSAHRALTAVPEVGVLLPCNVTVSVEEGRTVVRAMNPRSALGILDQPELEEVAAEVGEALERVVRSLEG